MPYHAAIRKLTWALTACFMTAILMMFASIYYTNKTQRQWCDLLTTLDGAYRATPPSTATGQEVAKQINLLTQRVDCPPSPFHDRNG